MSTQVMDSESQKFREIREDIRTQMLAFPGVTLAMLHPRLTQKHPDWRQVLDELLIRREVVQKYDELEGRKITRLYWHEDAPSTD